MRFGQYEGEDKELFLNFFLAEEDICLGVVRSWNFRLDFPHITLPNNYANSTKIDYNILFK
jgi:hypothetical protein